MASPNGPFGERLAISQFGENGDGSEKSVVRVWSQLLESLRDPQRRPPLFACLTRPQRVSLELIWEWWKEEEEFYPDNALCKGFYSGDFLVDDVWPHTLYRDRLFRIWHRELSPMKPDAGSIQMEDLNVLRQAAATSAAAHRTSLAAFLGMETRPVTKGHPCYRISDPPISASIQPCSWLNNPEESGYPYYLWDILEKKTVKCPSNGAAYVVVSHTWGRWQQPEGIKVRVKGVPWQVPANTLFDVTELPRILQKVPFETHYVWLDLVCIPQDGRRRQSTEISRQAAIFASAKWATIWFNQVASWDGLLAAIDWMSMMYLKRLVQDRFGDTVFDILLEERADVSTGLVNVEDPADARAISKFDGWFTSLWTLQEACMRPDLFFATITGSL